MHVIILESARQRLWAKSDSAPVSATSGRQPGAPVKPDSGAVRAECAEVAPGACLQLGTPADGCRGAALRWGDFATANV